jgi:hypothetical protein
VVSGSAVMWNDWTGELVGGLIRLVGGDDGGLDGGLDSGDDGRLVGGEAEKLVG